MKWLIIYGTVEKPEEDEVKGYFDEEYEADIYCKHCNKRAAKNHFYKYIEIKNLSRE